MQARALLGRMGLMGLIGALAIACAEGTRDDDSSLELEATQASPNEPGSRLPPTMGDAGDAGVDVEAQNLTPDTPGVDASIDSGSTQITCPTPIDISKSGTFTIDTCIAKSNLTATCSTNGSGPGVLLMGDAPNTGSTYQLSVASDWVIQQSDGACKPMPYSCSASGWGVSGYMGATGWYFIVERADGACGTTTVTVNRVQ